VPREHVLALKPISRRAIRIPYVSPFICQLTPAASGSASGAVSVLDILPTEQLAGPTLAVVLLEDGAVSLTWSNTVPNAYAYIVYRSDTVDGPYSVIASGVIGLNFVDNPPSGTYLYKVTAIEPDFGETTASNVVSAIVP
jgi:hypothetical protein